MFWNWLARFIGTTLIVIILFGIVYVVHDVTEKWPKKLKIILAIITSLIACGIMAWKSMG